MPAGRSNQLGDGSVLDEQTYGRRSGTGGKLGALVVDDHQAVRTALERLLGADGDLVPVTGAASASEAIWRARRLRPLVAVVDYRLPGRDGICLTLDLKRLREPPGVVIYSGFAGTRLVLAAIVAGADGIVEKGAGAQQLRSSVIAVAAGTRVMPALSSSALYAATAGIATEDLTIVTMLNGGASPSEVAEALGIAREWLELRRWAIVRLLVGPAQSSPR